MRAIAHMVPDDPEEPYTLELYFQNDPMPEVGFAFEVVVSLPLLEGNTTF
jgi:hypothetical protein